ncbi:hypothetical protein CK516_12165 [Nostoc sp. 'Peltigera malacea cyanobiont' DB3992]|nr:hypothetical protein CK516_12165 [Nostoc sp. 'Peltigera malacea cyanobiont' DB3992]
MVSNSVLFLTQSYAEVSAKIRGGFLKIIRYVRKIRWNLNLLITNYELRITNYELRITNYELCNIAASI